jgi:hypothetical protein
VAFHPSFLQFEKSMARRCLPRKTERFTVIASQRVGAQRRPMTGSAKQSISPRKERMDCFVASLFAMTA